MTGSKPSVVLLGPCPNPFSKASVVLHEIGFKIALVNSCSSKGSGPRIGLSLWENQTYAHSFFRGLGMGRCRTGLKKDQANSAEVPDWA